VLNYQKKRLAELQAESKKNLNSLYEQQDEHETA